MRKIQCCFCGKELLNKNESHNPEPLSRDSATVCCAVCNLTYVRPIRRILWNPAMSKTESNVLADNLQGISTDELKGILSQKSPLNTIRKRAGWKVS